ncbi:MAG: hypothetical protein J6S69_01580, partial [Proteobacteria bacterium]|nr:hypothetical protein [Pseudomonadota bacterium]
KADEPKADEPKADEPKADEPKADEPKADEPKADEPKASIFETGQKKDDIFGDAFGDLLSDSKDLSLSNLDDLGGFADILNSKPEPSAAKNNSLSLSGSLFGEEDKKSDTADTDDDDPFGIFKNLGF